MLLCGLALASQWVESLTNSKRPPLKFSDDGERVMLIIRSDPWPNVEPGQENRVGLEYRLFSTECYAMETDTCNWTDTSVIDGKASDLFEPATNYEFRVYMLEEDETQRNSTSNTHGHGSKREAERVRTGYTVPFAVSTPPICKF